MLPAGANTLAKPNLSQLNLSNLLIIMLPAGANTLAKPNLSQLNLSKLAQAPLKVPSGQIGSK